ncbi:MAG TPA: alpha-L-arabinofuranosidase C-terminal domain-containing protein, partial [Vicinamibacterales bacterium]|nr:alpha-L-arabinofuranosidase C-terminal domain-containing protein [Vicinamibacterales bacterium]
MRTLLALALALLLVCLPAAPRATGVAQAPALVPARIKIDVDRQIGVVDPLLFGSFTEHLGRMIYGGIYEEGSPLSDADGFRIDVMQAVKDLGITILRWPGGNFASSYNWFDGIGPKDRRPARLDLAWNDLESNRFGTDEFLRYSERVGAEPYICINLGLGTIDDARFWVEYTNSKQRTHWADERRRNGREAPWSVKYWALGNEIDGPWQMGHKNAEDYAKMALEAGKAMRAVDPTIKLIANGASNYGADWVAWNRTVLQVLRNQVDYIALHTYINNSANDFERYLGTAQQNVDRYIATTAAQIKEVQTGANPRPIYIAYDEWNVWYRTGNAQKLEEIYTFEDAVAMGGFFNSFFRRADIVKMANIAQLVNVIAPIMANRDGLFLQPIYFPIVEYGRQRNNVAVDAFVSAPTYKLPNRPVEPMYLDVSSTWNPTTREVFVNVVNRSKDKDLVTAITIQDRTPSGTVRVWQMNHPDLKATHTYGDDKKVRPATSTADVAVTGNTVTYTFPAHSLTILKIG